MKKIAYPIDNSSILFLAQMRRNHTNTYRFTMTLTEEVCPETLQKAVARVYRRFPTIIAGFRPGFFEFSQVPADTPPQVRPDPGCLLTMTPEEIRECAYRVLYRGKEISIEAFHALTDGYGAIASFSTLVAEYLRLRHGLALPAGYPLLDVQEAPAQQELDDGYLAHQEGKPLHLPSRYAYQLPGDREKSWDVRVFGRAYHTQRILDAARSYGVSATALLSGVMARAIMALQQRHRAGHAEKQVRIMVPVDLRRLFSSSTLRNFVLYALPTMEPDQRDLPLRELLRSFQSQIRSQLDRKQLASIMSYNVKAQLNWLFRAVPRAVKCAFMRLIYRYFGESNSCITLTNLGELKLPEAMRPYVRGAQVFLTPRARSPYNCAIISYGGLLSINISSFRKEPELEEIFFAELEKALEFTKAS